MEERVSAWCKLIGNFGSRKEPKTQAVVSSSQIRRLDSPLTIDAPRLRRPVHDLPFTNPFMTHKPRNKSPKDHPHSSITPSPQSLTQSTQHGSNNILSSVPYESLAHITATLSPADLFNLSLVNHALFSHVADDNTWHVAFDWHFLSLSPESDDPLEDDERSIMLRRTESTWRREFVKRFNLSRYVHVSRPGLAFGAESDLEKIDDGRNPVVLGLAIPPITRMFPPYYFFPTMRRY